MIPERVPTERVKFFGGPYFSYPRNAW